MWITKSYEAGIAATFWVDIPDTTENRKYLKRKGVIDG